MRLPLAGERRGLFLLCPQGEGCIADLAAFQSCMSEMASGQMTVPSGVWGLRQLADEGSSGSGE